MDDLYTEIINSVLQSLNEIVDKAVLGITAIMGVGLVIFGVKWIVGQLKDFFMMISGDSGGSGGSGGDHYMYDYSDCEWEDNPDNFVDYDYDIDED